MADAKAHDLKRIGNCACGSLVNFLLIGVVVIGAALGPAGDSANAQPGERFTPPARGERHTDKLNVGDPAPDFKLPDPTGAREVALSSFKNKKPAVLVFGSCT